MKKGRPGYKDSVAEPPKYIPDSSAASLNLESVKEPTGIPPGYGKSSASDSSDVKRPVHLLGEKDGFGNGPYYTVCGNFIQIDMVFTEITDYVTCVSCYAIMDSYNAVADLTAQKAEELGYLKSKGTEGHKNINKRAEILRTAEKLINGDRADTYGPPEVSFGRIANLLNAMGWCIEEGQDTKKSYRPLDAIDVSLGLVQLKVSRIISSPDHEDSWVDAAGYAALGGEMATRKKDSLKGETNASI